MKKIYRKNVGIVILKNKLIFSGFRIDVDQNTNDGWQMPQGGIEENENIIDASYREMFEETGITKDKVKFVAQMPNSIKYDFTHETIEKMKEKYNGILYSGQEQYWIVFDFLGKDSDINLKQTMEYQEFSKFDWKTSEFLLRNIIQMKKQSYKQVFDFLKKINKI